MRLVFDGFEIDQDGPRLVRDGAEVPLERRTLDLLCYLAQHPGRLVGKDELLTRVWNAHALSDGVLSNTVAKLRKALGQGARDREPIETVHGRGYRFHAVGQPRPPLTAAAQSAVPVRADPLVGRHVILRMLEQSLERAANGSGQLVLITGEAGIGKSRMLEELASRARALGFSVWQGAAYAGGAAPAYWPWVEIVRAALGDAGMRRRIPSDSWAISTLVPELLGATRPSDDAHALRFRLFDELTRWFASAAADAPRLIVIEDLHWADTTSIELLGHLARGLERSGVLLAAAVRELDSHGVEDVAVSRLSRSAMHLALRGLSQSEVSELVRELAAHEPEARFAELLYERTQGNPFFVRQVLQLLAQRGQPLAAASVEATELPPAVRDVIQQRLAVLPADTRSLLKAAAVIGQAFEAALLARIAELPLTAIMPALEPALRLGLIRSHERLAHGFEFNHSLVRDSLYDELGLAPRGALHAQLARTLAEHSPKSDARRLGEIARHSLLAVPSDLDSCVEHCRRAAEAARDASGFEASAAFLLRALEKLAAEGGDRALRCELLYQLGLDQFCAGDIETGWRALEDGARLASEIGEPRWLARFACRLSSWLEIGGIPMDLPALVEDALARTAESDELRAALLAWRAGLGSDLGRDERRALYCSAEQLAASSAVPEIMLDVAIARVCQRDPTQIDEGRAAIAAYRALEERHPRALLGIQHRLRRVAVELTEYWCALIEGDLESADLAIAQCDAAVEACRVPQLRCAVELLRANRAIADNRLDDAAACIERIRAGSTLAGGLGMVWLFCAARLAEAKRDESMLGQLGTAVDLSVIDRLAPQQRAGASAWVAAFLARSGNHALARGVLSRMPSTERDRMPIRYGDLGTLCSLAEAYWELEDATDAERLYGQLAPFAALNAAGVAYEYKGSVAHYLGMLALLLGKPADAVEHLQAALAFNRKLGMQLQLRQTRDLLARACALA
jgi:DNA-binding winged helix-turn-helix (wHTH) protein